MTRKDITVAYLARVEGEGGLSIKIRDGAVAEVKLRIFEPPRFFEAFLRGRTFAEAPDITARICGICPVAYQTSAVNAMEHALSVQVPPEITALRRLLFCGEWIESHALHVFFLHAPDFLGYEDAIRMAADHGEVVQRALRMKKLGNEIMRIIGGREVHPVNFRVGGFYKAPARRDLAALAPELEWAYGCAVDAIPWAAGLTFPDFEQPYEFVALRNPDRYAIENGRLVSSRGIDAAVNDYLQWFHEEHVEHSNALHSVVSGRGPYHVGPLARFNLSFDQLPAPLQDAARAAGLVPPCLNPFKSLVVRLVELAYACGEALRLIRDYCPPDPPGVDCRPRGSTGHGWSEAPRGVLYHRYRLDDTGHIQDAKIVPPTAQNLRMMEADLRAFVAPRVDMPVDRLTWECEQAVRNYDPCISCATHFLKLDIQREG
jgi:coenzyme F420-reducing hydrogenase alpha subunit